MAKRGIPETALENFWNIPSDRRKVSAWEVNLIRIKFLI